MKRFLVLYDKRGYTASSLEKDARGMIDKALLKQYLMDNGADEVEIVSVHDLVFPCNYRGWYVIYPSDEVSGLFYKEFIEDILLRLMKDGAILLPRFELFRAHHNKSFMELYRTVLSEDYNTIQTVGFYGIDDLKHKLAEQTISYPVVVKTSQGAGSAGVAIAKSEAELLSVAKKMSKITYYNNYETWFRKKGRDIRKIIRKSTNSKAPERVEINEKLIIQTFIPNLGNDYKVLVFNEKYYLLKRLVRDGDFRASGSGKLLFPDKLEDEEMKVLSFARQAYAELNTPLLSIDIAYDGNKCHMVEFQCLNFGPYTIQFSDGYHLCDENGNWSKIEKKSILEEEMAKSYIAYINRNEE